MFSFLNSQPLCIYKLPSVVVLVETTALSIKILRTCFLTLGSHSVSNCSKREDSWKIRTICSEETHVQKSMDIHICESVYFGTGIRVLNKEHGQNRQGRGSKYIGYIKPYHVPSTFKHVFWSFKHRTLISLQLVLPSGVSFLSSSYEHHRRSEIKKV